MTSPPAAPGTPDADQALVQAVWNAALTVGYRAGKIAAAPRWDSAALLRLRTALADAGYTTMASKVQAAIDTVPPQHPADTDAVRTRPDTTPAPWGRRP
ncbi:MAG: hypothetical protein JWO98_1228 [Frankiales bacterium]|nr:hypothetical protein [Frankiales bacterium]